MDLTDSQAWLVVNNYCFGSTFFELYPREKRQELLRLLYLKELQQDLNNGDDVRLADTKRKISKNVRQTLLSLSQEKRLSLLFSQHDFFELYEQDVPPSTCSRAEQYVDKCILSFHMRVLSYMNGFLHKHMQPLRDAFRTKDGDTILEIMKSIDPRLIPTVFRNLWYKSGDRLRKPIVEHPDFYATCLARLESISEIELLLMFMLSYCKEEVKGIRLQEEYKDSHVLIIGMEDKTIFLGGFDSSINYEDIFTYGREYTCYFSNGKLAYGIVEFLSKIFSFRILNSCMKERKKNIVRYVDVPAIFNFLATITPYDVFLKTEDECKLRMRSLVLNDVVTDHNYLFAFYDIFNCVKEMKDGKTK